MYIATLNFVWNGNFMRSQSLNFVKKGLISLSLVAASFNGNAQSEVSNAKDTIENSLDFGRVGDTAGDTSGDTTGNAGGAGSSGDSRGVSNDNKTVLKVDEKEFRAKLVKEAKKIVSDTREIQSDYAKYSSEYVQNYMIENYLKPLLLTNPENIGKRFDIRPIDPVSGTRPRLSFCVTTVCSIVTRVLESYGLDSYKEKKPFIESNSRAFSKSNAEYLRDAATLDRPSADNGYRMPIQAGDIGISSSGAHTYMISEVLYITEDTPVDVIEDIKSRVYVENTIKSGMIVIERTEAFSGPSSFSHLYENYDEFLEDYTDSWGNDYFIDLPEMLLHEVPNFELVPNGVSEYVVPEHSATPKKDTHPDNDIESESDADLDGGFDLEEDGTVPEDGDEFEEDVDLEEDEDLEGDMDPEDDDFEGEGMVFKNGIELHPNP